ncbi:MAG: hydrogenase, partial [Bacteroidia bacterium]|nr:hydrogenase [Bacteroidia bacterium]
MFESPIREPLILGRKTYRKITDDLVSPILGPASWKWYLTTGFTALVMFAGFAAIAYTIWVGIGTWGLNKTVGWAFDI